MSILVYAESDEGVLKKSSLELASYGKALSDALGIPVNTVVINTDSGVSTLSKHGISNVLSIKADILKDFNPKTYAKAIQQAAIKKSAKWIIIGSSTRSKAIAPMLSYYLDASYAPNVLGLPETKPPFLVRCTTFSSKAFCDVELTSEVKILGIANNTFGVIDTPVTFVEEEFSVDMAPDTQKIVSIHKNSEKLSIADADIVVSGGRGLKGPENWNLVESLADVLGAAIACSKPVSDAGWRPHSEHVGQTGKPVSANLYIAIGISGAIQHIAGINASKYKLVINNDPEASFFKVADYGIVGDAFEVVPKLVQKLKELK